jgi:CheY-like chemotaxis protein
MKKLLIVDDEEAMRGLYRKRLADAYQVFETGDPEQALALALENKPDAILLDLKMPKYNGFELCQNFRSLSPTSGLPIFIITGQSGDHKEECKNMGATGYFEKPIDFKKLKQTLQTTFETWPARRPGGEDLRMRVALKLAGRDSAGEQFADHTETESVSANGFLCVSTRKLDQGSKLDVFLVGQNDVHAGVASVAESAPAGLDRHRYRFRFYGEKENWIVQ